MSLKRNKLNPREGEEIPVSVLSIERREEMLWISSRPVPAENFPPCINNILRAGGERGRHRSAAILASFLGQAGWSEDDARSLWSGVFGDGVEDRIFAEWFARMHCPKCETMIRKSSGYPYLGIANLGLCMSDERCREFQGPVEYAANVLTEDDRSRGHLLHIRTLCSVRVFDWSSGREGEIELSAPESAELEGLLKEPKDEQDKTLIFSRTKVRGRLRPKFLLKQAEGPRRQMLSEFL